MDKKTFSIGILSLTGLILLVATLLPTRPASADFAVKDVRGMQMITSASQQGGDVLYIIEPNSGKVLVLGYSPTTKDIRPVAKGDLNQAFGGNSR
jgi:hypothetical protein